MMATRALSGVPDITQALDISRDEPDLCIIRREEAGCYRGEWSQGFGFVEVRFPKETTRDLTDAERAHYEHVTLVGPQGQRWPALAPLVEPTTPDPPDDPPYLGGGAFPDGGTSL